MRKSDLLELISEINESYPDEKLIVVGSQALHAISENLPEIARRSIECDFLFGEGKSAIRAEINKQLGIFSDFQLEHGFYADALGLATVVLPNGWQDRLVSLTNESGEIVAYSAEIHDIAVSKFVAGREKDFEFLDYALVSDIVLISDFLKRISLVRSKVENDVLKDRLLRLVKFLNHLPIHRRNIEHIRSFIGELRD